MRVVFVLRTLLLGWASACFSAAHAHANPPTRLPARPCPQDNDLQMIVRAHECVMDGFERFAQGHLITLFSATNYCGTANNAGALGAGGRAGSRGCAPIALFLPNAPRHPSPPSHFTPSPSRCHPSVGPGPGDGAQAHPPATTAAGVAAGVRLGRRRRGRAPQPRPGHMDAGGQRRAPPHAAPGAGWKRVAVAGILRVKGGGRASRGVWGILSNFGGAAAGMETFGTAVLGRGGALVTNLFSDVNSCSAARWGALSTSPRAPRGQSNRWPTPTARASPRACPACRPACRRVPGAGAACVGSTGGVTRADAALLGPKPAGVCASTVNW